ncbi:MAG: hypothetical protein KIS91_05235 [Anaerolineae bacterium]|nr:hypothetical protein [Anaerolineae bacterium]
MPRPLDELRTETGWDRGEPTANQARRPVRHEVTPPQRRAAVAATLRAAAAESAAPALIATGAGR